MKTKIRLVVEEVRNGIYKLFPCWWTGKWVKELWSTSQFWHFSPSPFKKIFWSYICLFTDVVSQFREKGARIKRELPGGASVKAVRRGMWESRPGRQPCCGWQQFLRASGKGKGGSGSFRLGVCSSRWVLRRMLLEDCNFLPGNSWSKKRLKIFNSRWVGYRGWTFLDLAYCHAFGAHDRFISV